MDQKQGRLYTKAFSAAFLHQSHSRFLSIRPYLELCLPLSLLFLSTIFSSFSVLASLGLFTFYQPLPPLTCPLLLYFSFKPVTCCGPVPFSPVICIFCSSIFTSHLPSHWLWTMFCFELANVFNLPTHFLSSLDYLCFTLSPIVTLPIMSLNSIMFFGMQGCQFAKMHWVGKSHPSTFHP